MADPETEEEPEIEVEGESWTGLVVVADRRREGSGEYGLVRAEDWCRNPVEVTVWRGPTKPDETVRMEDLVEVTCRTVLVDAEGFYTCIREKPRRYYPCPETTERFHDAVEKAAEKVLDEWGNERAAETRSYIDHEDASEQLDSDEIFAVATFGDATAVNGELVHDTKRAKPPRGWTELTDLGGHIPDGGESEHDKEYLAEAITDDVSKEMKVRADPRTILRVIDVIHGRSGRYMVWGSGSGDAEVWVPRKVARAYEAKKEKEARDKLEAEERRREEKRRKAEEEYRAKIRKGGFPKPKYWSPRGKLPGER